MIATYVSTGATMSVILDLPFAVCNWISAAVAIIYTLMGGLYSVAYTDVIQLVLMFISLVSFLTSWFSYMTGFAGILKHVYGLTFLILRVSHTEYETGMREDCCSLAAKAQTLNVCLLQIMLIYYQLNLPIIFSGCLVAIYV